MNFCTLGHSTRTLEEFLELLKFYKINFLIDVRAFPRSRHNPQFNKEILETELPKNNIVYIHFEKLGGFREGGYENFSKTQEFKDAVSELEKICSEKTAAIMCAEIVVYKCHRRYISKELAERGHNIIHIVSKEKIIEDKFASAKKPRIKCE